MATPFYSHFASAVKTGLACASRSTRGAIEDGDMALAGRRVR